MRNRIVAVMVATVVAVVLLYGIPRAYLLADLVQDHEHREIQRSADLAAVAVTERQQGGGELTEDFLEQLLHTQESIDLVAADGTRLRVGLPPSEDSPDDVVAVRTLPDGGEMTMRRSGDLVGARVGAALLPVVLIGLLLVTASALVLRVVAERLSRPFLELAEIADAIGQGTFEVTIPHYRMAEAEAISEALRRGVSRLAELRSRERDITTNASHELRSPISALRMEIEDLASWPQTPPDVSAELTSYLPQLDRLNTAVRTYLDTAQTQRLTDVDVVDLSALVHRALQRWRAPVAGTRRGLPAVVVDEPHGAMPVRASSATVDQILNHLLQDAVDRGATRVTVELESNDDYGQVRLGLEGQTAPAGERARAAAAHTALSVDGRVSIVDRHSTLLLRRAR